MTKNAYRRAAESYAREAKGSPADRWTKAHTQQVRDGQRAPMFKAKTFGPGDVEIDIPVDSCDYGDFDFSS